MSAKKFRFVSPGIFMNEIDKSLLPKEGAPVGPVVIGRTQRGPGLRPVTVNSFLEFTEIFGTPIPGGETGDVWREGNRTSPTYASYAARAWLKNGTPLTVVRVLGEKNKNADTAGDAGWTTSQGPATAAGSPGGTASEGNGGFFGLYIAKQETSASDNLINAQLAAVFYFESGSIRLQGKDQDGTGTIPEDSGSAVLVQNEADDYGFKAILDSQAGAGSSMTASFNFDPKSDQYIRNVFNTNPTLLGTTSNSAVTYFLGETFDHNLLAKVTDGDKTKVVGFLAAVSGGRNREEGAKAASSGMVISQDTAPTSSWPSSEIADLFELKALDTGEWINSNVKISISDIAPSVNPDWDPYGTFTVEVRDARDNDQEKMVLETFAGCNLNPNSANYVCTKIGDKHAEWQESTKRYIEYGDYNNNSKYVYVSPSDDMTNGALAESLLPFGFKGPITYATTTGSLKNNLESTAMDANILWSTSDNYISGSGAAENPLTCSGPTIPLRLSTTASGGGFADPTDAYWGITTNRAGSRIFDPSYVDATRMLPKNDDTADPLRGTEPSFTFSLDNVSYISSSAAVGPGATYTATERIDGDSITAGGPTPDAVDGGSAGGPSAVLDAGFNKFTMPMVGGFDGFDIFHSNPLSQDLITAGSTELNSYEVNSLKRAIDTISDPEVVEMNVAAIPGITAPVVTNYLIEACEQRADALAIIDLEGGYTPVCDTDDWTEESDLGSVDQTVDALKLRSLNSSYACAYFPWVQTKDEFGSGKVLWVPPSVAALGTFASNDKKSAPWFAPAGFTRGGLSDGAAGIPVIGVREHLTRKMRDKLYENNVNPIAKFPAEGIVIFGQKTLQATPSALDRVNVRRMMLHVKKGISNIASTLLFDQNVKTTWARFLGKADPFLRDVQAQLGLTDYKIVLDETTTTPDLVDRNIMYAKIFLKPARSIEFIAIDFVIQRTGASFED